MSATVSNTLRHRESRLAAFLRHGLEFLQARAARRRAIHELERLSDQALLDVGLERCDIATRVDAGTNDAVMLTLRR